MAGGTTDRQARRDVQAGARIRANSQSHRGRASQPQESHLSPEPLKTTRTGEPKETKHRAQRAKEKAYEKTPERFKNASSFQVRLRTGVIYISLNIVCILASDVTTMVILAATSAICAGEFYYMLRSDAKMPNEAIGVVGAAAYPVASYFFGLSGIIYVTAALMLAITLWYVYWLRARMSDVGVCLFGAMYTGLQLSGQRSGAVADDVDSQRYRHAQQLGEALRQSIADLNRRDRWICDIAASIGTFAAVPRKDDNLDDFLIRADGAMYRNKRSRRTN